MEGEFIGISMQCDEGVWGVEGEFIGNRRREGYDI